MDQAITDVASLDRPEPFFRLGHDEARDSRKSQGYGPDSHIGA
jgi:hypothetical protein